MKLSRLCIVMSAFIVLFFASCIFRPIGKCAYDKNPPRQGRVKIVSINLLKTRSDDIFVVTVTGLFNRSFKMTPGQYNRCISERKLKVGSELTGYVHSGGPCPPMFWLEECPR